MGKRVKPRQLAMKRASKGSHGAPEKKKRGWKGCSFLFGKSSVSHRRHWGFGIDLSNLDD